MRDRQRGHLILGGLFVLVLGDYMDPRMKVAVVLPKELETKYSEKVLSHSLLELDYYYYSDVKDVRALVFGINKEVDGIIFSGLLSYERCTDIDIVKEKIVYCIPYDALNLVKLLTKLMYTGIDIKDISFDTAHKRYLYDALDDADICEEYPINVFEFDPKQDIEKVIEFHEKLYREGRTKYAISSISSCYLKLIERGIPCEVIWPTGASIRQALEYMEREYLKRIDKSKHVAIALVEYEIDDSNVSDKSRGVIEGRIIRHLQKMGEYLNGYYMRISSNRIVIITNRDYVSDYTKSFTMKLPIFVETNELRGLNLNVGIGIHEISNRAMENAKLALEEAQKSENNSCVVVEEDKIVNLFQASDKSENLEHTNIELIKIISENTSAGMDSIQRILIAVKELGNEFTVKDLVPFVSLNPKSLERIIREMWRAGYLTVVGNRTKATKGKPGRIYKFVDKL